MLRYEKRAFWKFFSIYFGSVAFLILVSGYFYFEQQKKVLIEKEHFSMIEYTRELKMKVPHKNIKNIHHKVVDIKIKNFNMNNFKNEEHFFVKYMPYDWKGGYIVVKKNKKHFYEKLKEMKISIVTSQIFLLLLFGLLSSILAFKALKPMRDAIIKLDNFSKDLIHDLNTPITSILLNMKILAKKREFTNYKALHRIQRSVDEIGALHKNLSVLLREENMVLKYQNIVSIIHEVVQTQEKIYPHIEIIVEKKEYKAIVNRDAFKQVMQNIISNACKYNVENGYVKIFIEEGVLYVEDSGVGIKNPNLIFERSYKEHTSGHGIGLDIVKRLCEAMEIEINASSKVGEGTVVLLKV